MTLIVVHQKNPSPYADEFVELDFSKPVHVIPVDHLPDYSEQKGIGSGLIPEGMGRWNDVAIGEGMLPEEQPDEFRPFVSRWEQDAWNNAIDGDDMQSGPDPYKGTTDAETYESAVIEAMKVHDILYGC